MERGLQKHTDREFKVHVKDMNGSISFGWLFGDLFMATIIILCLSSVRRAPLAALSLDLLLASPWDLCSYDKTLMKLEQQNIQHVETCTCTPSHVHVWWSETARGCDGFLDFFFQTLILLLRFWDFEKREISMFKAKFKVVEVIFAAVLWINVK